MISQIFCFIIPLNTRKRQKIDTTNEKTQSKIEQKPLQYMVLKCVAHTTTIQDVLKSLAVFAQWIFIEIFNLSVMRHFLCSNKYVNIVLLLFFCFIEISAMFYDCG